MAAASGYVRCGVCGHASPVVVLEPIGGASKVGRVAKYAAAGVALVGGLVLIFRLWPAAEPPAGSIERALSSGVAPLIPEAATVIPEPLPWLTGEWRPALETQVYSPSVKNGAP